MNKGRRGWGGSNKDEGFLGIPLEHMVEGDGDTVSVQKREGKLKRKEMSLQHHLQTRLAAIFRSMG